MKSIIKIMLCLLLIPLGVKADEPITLPTGWYIVPSIGYYFFDDDQDVDDNAIAQLGIGYQFSQRWAVEGNIGGISTDNKDIDGDADVYLWHLDTLYTILPNSEWKPYLVAGIGHYDINKDNTNDDKGEQANVGLGVQRLLSPALSMRLDARALHTSDEGYTDYMANLGFAYYFGYPSRPPKDQDGDGVLDADDACPDTPAGVEVDSVGCPLDSDNDGVPDYMDQCPNTPENTVVDSTGCPLDSDGDGVPDYMDQCPNTPQYSIVNEQGCEQLAETVRMELAIEFDVDKAIVKPQYHDELASFADFLKRYSDITTTIEGHTDSTGEASYNQQLSQRRAQAVCDYLVNNFGISADRLTPVGYGESQPIDTNDTPEGRQRNRRVVGQVESTQQSYRSH